MRIKSLIAALIFLPCFVFTGCGKSVPDYLDLTAMNDVMVMGYVNEMVNLNSEAYLGKTVKAKGDYILDENGMHRIIIKDALACCQQGIEIQWTDEFPDAGQQIQIEGKFEKEVKSVRYYIAVTELSII